MQKLDTGKDRAVLQARKKIIAIIEDILTIKCPRQHCRQAFVDFDACFALTCDACTCAFCAYVSRTVVVTHTGMLQTVNIT
jgi:hypothetical protein